MQEKVLVLDIDGTLTNSKKEITEATKQGIWNIFTAWSQGDPGFGSSHPRHAEMRRGAGTEKIRRIPTVI